MAQIAGRCAECFKRLGRHSVEGQEGHTPAEFCSEEHKALHARSWISCVRSSYEQSAKAEARALHLRGKRFDDYVSSMAASAIRAHIRDYRPDLSPYYCTT